MADFTPHETPAHEAQALPVMHPGRPVGRDEALKQIYTHLKNNQPVLLHGEAGIGKTALAAALASAYTGQPGGVLWLNVDNTSLPELMARIGRAYEVEDITVSDNPLGKIGAVASTLTQNKPLIVLDGPLETTVANQFIVKCADNLPVILTMEDNPDGPWQGVEVGPLSDADAAALFKQKAGLAADDSSSDIDVYGIVKLLQYKPFPIVVAARAMVASKKSAAEYFKLLQAAANAVDGDPNEAALTLSFRALTGALQGLVLMLGAIFGAQASPSLLSMISNAPVDSVTQALTVLAQLHLVERFMRFGDPYFRLHTIVRDFAQDRLEESGNLSKLQEKVRDSVVAYTEQHNDDSADTYQKLAAEMDTFINVARWSSEQGDRKTANRLVVALTQAGDFVNECGYVYELLQLRNYGSGDTTAFPAYSPPQAEAIHDPRRFLEEFEEDEESFFEGEDFEAGFEDEEDEVFAGKGFAEEDEDFEDDYEDEDFEEEEPEEEADEDLSATAAIEAIESGSLEGIDLNQLRAALGQARQQHDTDRQIQILKAIGKVQIDQKMENESIATYNELLSLYETAENNAGILETLDMLSALMAKTENSQAAVMNATRGIKLAEELSDDETRMHLLTTLGDSRQQLGETEEAVESFSKALEIARKRDDTQNEAIILYNLGYAQLDDGDPNTAIENWEQALQLFKQQGKRDYEGRVLGGMGTAYGELERWSEAIRFHTSALHIARAVKDKEEEALQLSNLGLAGLRAEQLPDALLRYRQALHLAYESGNRDNIVSAIVDLVRLMLRSRRLLPISELLIQDAASLEPGDKDVTQLLDQVRSQKQLAEADGIDLAPVNGTSRDYAALAYKLLEE